MYRTSVILRHTFFEAISQPIYPLMLLIGSAILAIFTYLPFFTLGEDTRMFKSVGLDVILLLTLVVTLMATSKSIYEEIEDRTMLTLMSKPVARWEVLVGKYLGLILAAALAIAVMGAVLLAGTYERIPADYLISTKSLYAAEGQRAWDTRMMHMAGIYPSLVLIWLQVSGVGSDQRRRVDTPVAGRQSAAGDHVLFGGKPDPIRGQRDLRQRDHREVGRLGRRDGLAVPRRVRP